MSELVWGIKNGDLDQVKDLIEKKEIDINKEIDGRSPIHYAADYGQHDVIQYLISKGSDVNVKRVLRFNSTDLHLSVYDLLRKDQLGDGRILKRNCSGRGYPISFRSGSYNNSYQVKDKYGISALLAAIWEGHTSCVKLLLEHGASKDGTTPDGTSYLDAAEKEEIKLLLQK